MIGLWMMASDLQAGVWLEAKGVWVDVGNAEREQDVGV